MQTSRNYYIVFLISIVLIAVLGCESQSDKTVLEWVEMLPPVVSGVTTSVAELAKIDTFDWDEWIKQGRELPNAEETIIRLLQCNDSRLDRRKAMLALGDIGTEKSVPILIECLHDRWTSSGASVALKRIGVANDEVRTALLNTSHYAADNESINAIWALACIYKKDAIGAIKQRQKTLKREMVCLTLILDDVENGREPNLFRRLIRRENGTWEEKGTGRVFEY
jgi:hypothetical protein